MISFFKSEDGKVERIEGYEPGCWIDVLEPTASDRTWLLDTMGLAPEFVKSAFDDEETSHVDVDDDTGQILVIVDCPFVEAEDEVDDKTITQYDTHPLTFVFLPERECFVTFSLRRNETVANFANGRYSDVHTGRRTQFLLKMLLRITQRYVVSLRSISRQIREYERTLRKTMANSELMKMLGLEKSLVYFSTSLQGLDSTVSRIGYGRMFSLYEEDHPGRCHGHVLQRDQQQPELHHAHAYPHHSDHGRAHHRVQLLRHERGGIAARTMVVVPGRRGGGHLHRGHPGDPQRAVPEEVAQTRRGCDDARQGGRAWRLQARKMAEEVGFEPTEPRGSTVFKTAAFDHSATPPRLNQHSTTLRKVNAAGPSQAPGA